MNAAPDPGRAVLTLLADALTDLLQGRSTAQQFRAVWSPRRSKLPLLDVVLSNVDHYLADTDIRARDEEHRRMQDADLEKMITLLRQGATDRLSQITFLHRSGG